MRRGFRFSDSAMIISFVTSFVPLILTAQIPGRLSLGQNYPNPFNGATVIPFDVEKAGQVDLSVCNLRGEKIFTLDRGFYQPGRYRVVFDASDLPSGVYFYRLSVGDRKVHRKCLYIK